MQPSKPALCAQAPAMLRMLPPSSSPMEWLERWALSQTGYTTDRDKTFARGTVHADGSRGDICTNTVTLARNDA